MSGDTITLGVAERWCHEYERALRASFASEENPTGRLPSEWEERLASPELSSTTLRSALLRYGQLCRWYGERSATRVQKKTQAPAEAMEAAREILAREPVIVTLAGHRVKVTSRSYAAMAEISAHELRIRSLTEDINWIARCFAVAQKQRRRSRARRLQELHRRLYGELLAHRRALYAHALTSHGGRAQDPASEAPTWWHELTPEDDARLLLALLEAGPARYARLGQPPPVKKETKKGEDFGFVSLLATWEKTLKLRPAALYDEDLALTLVSIRASVTTLDDLED